ncbi:hypothetical protein EVAR_78550_1 [Eumeta japonica]|uniref:Uncharacterized protein n=1 Tax=Eumeta variegata TaxID=151549 RepID=A0A4C1W8L3_EUMVA|nr:hypothetical protein EVAR_78550_1 [Eumeta japonica]
MAYRAFRCAGAGGKSLSYDSKGIQTKKNLKVKPDFGIRHVWWSHALADLASARQWAEPTGARTEIQTGYAKLKKTYPFQHCLGYARRTNLHTVASSPAIELDNARGEPRQTLIILLPQRRESSTGFGLNFHGEHPERGSSTRGSAAMCTSVGSSRFERLDLK